MVVLLDAFRVPKVSGYFERYQVPNPEAWAAETSALINRAYSSGEVLLFAGDQNEAAHGVPVGLPQVSDQEEPEAGTCWPRSLGNTCKLH
jgi:hypothetical protein